MARLIKMDALTWLSTLLFFSFSVIYCNGLVCDQCRTPVTVNRTKICEEFNSSSIIVNGSCCLNQTSTGVNVIGLDWSDCNLKTLPVHINNLADLQIIHLEGNEDLQISDPDFTGLTHLQSLYLPSGLACPGGNQSWEMDFINNTVRICQGELDMCLNNNITCPNNNSHCEMRGPGHIECLCNKGYHGYKCLNQGVFPTTPSILGIVAGTFVISVFLWCTQRRKIVKKTHAS